MCPFGKRFRYDLEFILVNYIADSLCFQHLNWNPVILKNCYQRPSMSEVFVCTVLEPRDRFALFAIERWLRSGKPGRLFQVFVEPSSNQLMLFFFVWIKLSLLSQVKYSLEHPKLPFRIFVDIGNNESQVHDYLRTAVISISGH
jgi:hypothetical protein